MSVIRWGLIGCGRISVRHIEAILRTNLSILSAVCDIVPARADWALGYYLEEALELEHFSVPPVKHTDYRDLLRQPGIDAIAICTESGSHAMIAREALFAGKHVLVEKPMALSTTDAEFIIEIADRYGLQLGVCHQNRFNPPIQALRKALEKGMFGRLLYGSAAIRWTRNDDYYAQSSWRGTWAQDGGTLMNQCIHNIDLLQWIMGDVDQVYAKAGRFLRPIEAEDTGVAILRFKNGSLGVVEGTVCVYPKNLEETLSIFGSAGTACLGGIAVNLIKTWDFREMSNEEVREAQTSSSEVDSVYGKGHEPLYRNFHEAMQGRAKLVVDGHEGKKALEIVLGIYKSVRTGQPVTFPLGDYSTVTDLEGKR